ncbi:MAG TPA: LytTR family DNA-binding domain-containing protein [Allosphingosinicella sp.]|nr:LytTR family DNA-binding domain-containing protein [Allosphingosinicella sp.]
MSDDQGVITDATAAGATGGRRDWRWGRELALGFGYWAGFLLILQPGNIFQAAKADIPLPFFEELLRILGASALGAAVTPFLLGLTRRFPVEGSRRWRHALVHAVTILCLSLLLIGLAQILAAWLLTDRNPRLQAPLDRQIVANGPLLILCMSSLVAGAHAVIFWKRAEQESLLLAQARHQVLQAAEPGAPKDYLVTVPVKSRGRTLLVAVSDIDWVETQGNYLALHVGPATHLIRETLASFESGLDPDRFVRIHRTTLVANDRVQEVAPLSNGDASIRLRDGTQLRLSRKYRTGAAALLGGIRER